MNWSIAGVGDFNGDGKSDILWRHTSGVNYVWYMNGVTPIGWGLPANCTRHELDDCESLISETCISHS